MIPSSSAGVRNSQDEQHGKTREPLKQTYYLVEGNGDHNQRKALIKQKRGSLGAGQGRIHQMTTRPLSLYLRQADESTFYNANVRVSGSKGQTGKLGGFHPGLPISNDDITLTQQSRGQQKSSAHDQPSLTLPNQTQPLKNIEEPVVDYIEENKESSFLPEEEKTPLRSEQVSVNLIPKDKTGTTAFYSVNVSNQLQRLNTEREETEFYDEYEPAGSPAASETTVVRDVEEFLQDTMSPILPLKCIRKQEKGQEIKTGSGIKKVGNSLLQVMKNREKRQENRDQIITQINSLLNQLTLKELELQACEESESYMQDIGNVRSRAQSYLQTLAGQEENLEEEEEVLPRCTNPAPFQSYMGIDDYINSSIEGCVEEEEKTERIADI